MCSLDSFVSPFLRGRGVCWLIEMFLISHFISMLIRIYNFLKQYVSDFFLVCSLLTWHPIYCTSLKNGIPYIAHRKCIYISLKRRYKAIHPCGHIILVDLIWFLVFNATFNNILESFKMIIEFCYNFL